MGQDKTQKSHKACIKTKTAEKNKWQMHQGQNALKKFSNDGICFLKNLSRAFSSRYKCD